MSGSMSSPLTLAMLAGGLGAQGQTMDPIYAAALPRLQLAQGMLQEGTQTTPVQSSKYGGLARLAQALVGNYALSNATTGLQQAYGAHQAANAADLTTAFGGGAAPPPAASMPTTGAPPVAPQMLPSTGSPSATYAPLIASTEQRDGIPPGQLGAALNKETGGEPNPATAVNPKSGATGVAQILPSTAAQPGYGVAPLPPGGALDPTKAIPFAADYVTARAKAAGLDMTNPDQAAKAWSLYGGDSSGRYGQQVVAQAGGTPTAVFNSTSTAPGTAPAAASGTAPAAAPTADPMAQYHRLQALAAKSAISPYPQDHALAAVYSSAAEQELTRLENTYTTGPDGISTNLLGKRNYPPRPTVAPNARGDLISYDAAGQPQGGPTQNPSGITGTGDVNNAMRMIVDNQPGSPGANPALYDLGMRIYQGYHTATAPATQQLVQVPERPPPQGMPAQTGMPTQAPTPSVPPVAPVPQVTAPGAPRVGAPPAVGVPGAPPVAPVPQVPSPQALGAGVIPLTGNARGPEAAQAITESQAKSDADEISKQQAMIQSGHNILGTTATIRANLPNVATGAGADQRLLGSQIGAALGVSPQNIQAWLGTNPVNGELLQKKLFELSTGAVRGMGAREPGSVLAMFQKNYPNLSSRDMTIDAMTRLIDTDQTNKEDEINGRQQYLNQQIQNVAQGQPYNGLGGYQQPDPRIYQAAALATAKLPYTTWSQGLSTQQQTQALTIAKRLWPDAGGWGPDPGQNGGPKVWYAPGGQ